MSLTGEQPGVLRGIAAAMLLTVLSLLAAILTDVFPLPVTDSPAERAGFAASWAILVVVWLVVAVGSLARHRFFNPGDIGGSGLADDSQAAKVKQAYLQNTLEQVVLAAVVYGMAAVLLPVAWLSSIPAAAILFAVGRVLFRARYEKGAAARALGFGLTFYPTVALLVVVIVAVFT